MNEDYYDVIEEIRAVLKTKPGKIQVQGHTDDVPIKTARFRSNWELSSSRAVTVAEALMNRGEVDKSRFEVSGFSDTKPLVKAKTRRARIRNRRHVLARVLRIRRQISPRRVLPFDRERTHPRARLRHHRASHHPASPR